MKKLSAWSPPRNISKILKLWHLCQGLKCMKNFSSSHVQILKRPEAEGKVTTHKKLDSRWKNGWKCSRVDVVKYMTHSQMNIIPNDLFTGFCVINLDRHTSLRSSLLHCVLFFVFTVWLGIIRFLLFFAVWWRLVVFLETGKKKSSCGWGLSMLSLPCSFTYICWFS